MATLHLQNFRSFWRFYPYWELTFICLMIAYEAELVNNNRALKSNILTRSNPDWHWLSIYSLSHSAAPGSTGVRGMQTAQLVQCACCVLTAKATLDSQVMQHNWEMPQAIMGFVLELIFGLCTFRILLKSEKFPLPPLSYRTQNEMWKAPQKAKLTRNNTNMWSLCT